MGTSFAKYFNWIDALSFIFLEPGIFNEKWK